jgi:hypothetical protein
MRLPLLVLFACALACGACSRSPARTGPAGGSRFALSDSAAVRRLCEMPDSVLAGRRACLLRDQRAPIRVF